jgi:hypothetical protein
MVVFENQGIKATCLMECGPPNDSISRKWIIDVDAAFKDLKALGFLMDDTICSEEVSPNVFIDNINELIMNLRTSCA